MLLPSSGPALHECEVCSYILNAAMYKQTLQLYIYFSIWTCFANYFHFFGI